MTVRIDELEALIKTKFNIPDVYDDESEVSAPMFHSHLGSKPILAVPICDRMSKRPGSVLLTSVNLSETFSRMIASRKDLRIAIILTVPRSDFVNAKGELLENMPFFSTKNFFLLFFGCDNRVIDEFIEELGNTYNVSVLDIQKYRHAHALQAKKIPMSDFSAITKCKGKPKKKRTKKGAGNGNTH